MKKYFLFFLLPVLIGGCEKTYNDVIDAKIISYQVISTAVKSANSDSLITYSPFDSLITISLKINSSKDISGIYFNIVAPDGNPLNTSQIALLDNGNAGNGDSTAGDNVFSNKFPMSRNDIVGLYTINFFVTDAGSSSKIAAVLSFVYDNGQNNVAPTISNLVMPDSIKKNVQFVFTINVADTNGLRDVKEVYYQTYNPSGTLVVNSEGISKFPMFDDGNTKNNGDITAGDGVYTVGLTFPSGQPSGTWRFVFQAIDLGGKLSNVINHNIVVQ